MESSLGPSAEETHTLATFVSADGWARGVERFLDGLPPTYTQHLRSSLNYGHTGWLALLPASHTTHAIGVDPGLGTVLIALARRFKRVTGLYRDACLRDVVRARLDSLGITNVVLVDVARIRDDAFTVDRAEAIVMYTSEPASVNGAEVARLARWLAPGGTLYTGVQGPPGWRSLVSAVVLRRRLRHCFAYVESYRQFHGLTSQSDLVRIEERAARFGRRVLAAFRAPAFSFLARATPDFALVRDIALARPDNHASTERDGPPGVLERYAMTRHGGCVLQTRAGNVGTIVRVPFSPEMLTRCEVNVGALQHLERIRIDGVPRSTGVNRVDGQHYFRETLIDGQPISADVLQNAHTRAAWLRAAVEWITRLHTRTARRHRLNGQHLERLVDRPFALAIAGSDPPSGLDVESIREHVRSSLLGRELPLVFAHGDYSVDNMLWDKRQCTIRGVFDWDCASDAALPLLDVLYLLFTAERVRKNERRTANLYRDYLFPAAFDAAEQGVLRAYCVRLGLNPDLLPALTVMTWAHHVLRIRHTEWYPSAASTRAIIWTPLRAAAEAIRGVRGLSTVGRSLIDSPATRRPFAVAAS